MIKWLLDSAPKLPNKPITTDLKKILLQIIEFRIPWFYQLASDGEAEQCDWIYSFGNYKESIIKKNIISFVPIHVCSNNVRKHIDCGNNN